MPTICPNCQQPVRTGAKYCGFCGTSLIMASEVITTPPALFQDQAAVENVAIQKKSIGSTARNTNQAVTNIAIILLFLVIMLSLVVRHWSDISPWMSQILP